MEKSEIYLEALINNDESLIKEIYQLVFPKAKKYILNNSGDLEDVQDVFHDALMYIIVSHQEKNLNIQSFEAYLFTICKNMWKRALKNRVMKSNYPTLMDETADMELFIIEQECFEFYIQKFQLLSENCQEILSEYFNGQSYEELMEEHDYGSINTIRQRVYKCRVKLINLIKADLRFKNIIRWGSI